MATNALRRLTARSAGTPGGAMVGVDQSDRVILVLVDVGAERRARDVGIDLISRRNQAVADHLKRDRIKPRIAWPGPGAHCRLTACFLR